VLAKTPPWAAEWRAMQAHRADMTGFRIGDALREDSSRATRWTVQAAGLTADLSRNLADDETLRLLLQLARAADVEGRRAALFAGEPVNNTEQRPAWHTALRTAPADDSVASEIDAERERFLDFAQQLRAGRIHGAAGDPISTVLCFGIGGSDLGPRLVTEALGEQSGPKLHFVTNIDPVELDLALADARPETTLLIAVSKSFTTLETLANVRAGLAWLKTHTPSLDPAQHLYAVTSQAARAEQFGVPREHVLTLPDWVGGRYSVWSACGLPVAIAHGRGAFAELLAGARSLDQHFLTAPLERNLPVLLGLLGIWYANFWDMKARAVVPYSQRLRHLPPYLQQLEMESNGKGVDRDGRSVGYDTSPIVWGEVGTTAQHSVFQFLHQGTHRSPIDFISCTEFRESREERERLLFMNMLAQADALALGDEALGGAVDSRPPHARAGGNRPSSVILLPRLDARSLGALLAAYEHRTFVQSVIWNINAFDQWGVEIGKKLLGQRLAASTP
jgi:glucose-6-phosphate isomerase